MFDYSTDFDPAPTSNGPWIHYYAKPSEEGFPAGSWVLSDATNKTMIDLSRGFVVDWPSTQTGWVQALGASGVPPIRRWNPTRARFEPKPAGDNWHKGFCVMIAYAPDAAATWEQWGVGVWIGFSEMFSALMQIAPAQLPQLPLIVPNGSLALKFSSGPSSKPLLQISRFVQRPSCLPENDAAPQSQIAAQAPARALVTPSFPSVPTPAAPRCRRLYDPRLSNHPGGASLPP